YYAKARVPNPDGILRLAMTTQNVIEIDHAENVLLLPSLVIQSDGRGGHTVQVLKDDNTVETRKVETGITNNVMTEIRSGLKEGEKIVATKMSASELADRLANPRSNRRR
ncbi:MAG: hypothetical protein IJY48_06725, partial [Mailhella sp.]|nr:hypothetical protein [Mailhella sp.]